MIYFYMKIKSQSLSINMKETIIYVATHIKFSNEHKLFVNLKLKKAM